MKTYTKDEMIKKVNGLLEVGLCEEAAFLIAEGISVCYENDSEIFETEDELVVLRPSDVSAILVSKKIEEDIPVRVEDKELIVTDKDLNGAK